MLAGSGVGGGTLVNWMTSIDAPADVRAEWAREHGLDGVDGAGVGRRRGRDRERARRRAGRRHPAEGRGDPARRGRARLGGGADPAQRHRLRRLRPLPVRLPARDEAVGDPGPPRDGGRGRGAARRRRRGDVGARRGRAGASASRRSCRRRPATAAGGDGARAGLVVAGAAGRPGRRARSARRRSSRRRGSTTRRSAGTCGSTRCRWSPGIFDEPIDMWRGTMQAARSLEFNRTTTSGRNGYAIESAPGHPGPDRARAAVGGHRRPRRAHGARSRHIAPLIAITRDGGEGRVRLTKSRPRPDRLPARRGRRRDAAPRARVDGAPRPRRRRARDRRRRRRRRAGTTDAVRRLGRRGAGVRRCSRTRCGPSTSARTAAASSRPTRWAPSGWAATRRTHPATRAAASARRPRRERGGRRRRPRPLRRRRLAVPDRDRRQPDDHDHGARPAGRADRPRGGLSRAVERQAAVGWTVSGSSGRRGRGALTFSAPAIRLRARMISATPTTMTAAGDELERRRPPRRGRASRGTTATTGLTKA